MVALRCTNNNNYPKLWTASSELVAEYFFDSPVECCATFYSPPLGAGTVSDGVKGEGKECIVEDVCLDTPTGYPLYYLDLDFGICMEALLYMTQLYHIQFSHPIEIQ